MTWLYYLLEANLYLAICYGFYLVFLRKETFYGLNRGYLICSSVLSFVIPLLKVGGFNRFMNDKADLDLVYMDPNLGSSRGYFSSIAVGDIASAVYLTIAAYFSIQMLISFYKIIALARKARRRRFGDLIYLELEDTQTAFSFFNLLFLNPASAEKDTILKHELVHIQQKHSLDILFFELLKILNWFNPIAWQMQQDIKLLHEYIADDLTTRKDVQKHAYAMFLIQNSFGVQPEYLTNQIFNPSILKRRINMLNRRRSAGRARLKLLLALPLVGGMLFASTVAFSKDYALFDLYPEQHNASDATVRSTGAIQEPVVQEVRFYRLSHKMDPNGKRVVDYDNRLVVINGNSTQSGVIMEVQGFDKMVELNASEARAKYADRGGSGALEFTGKNTKTLGLRDDVRFPPPIVRKQVPPPPPAPPASDAAGLKGKTNLPKKGAVKFPPPMVRKDVPPPPPPAPPASGAAGLKGKTNLPKKGEVKFPPPVVKKDVPPPPPPVEPVAPSTDVMQGQQG